MGMCEKCLVYFIAIVDSVVAIMLISVASFQFAKGAALLTGPQGENEKLSRLSMYAICIYAFLLIQLGMAIKLYKGAGKISKHPDEAVIFFGWWREWSIVCLMILLLHAIVVLMLMEDGQRRTISLICTLAHSALRPFGILAIGKVKRKMEKKLPLKF